MQNVHRQTKCVGCDGCGCHVHSCVDVHIYVNLDAKLCLCTNRHSVYVRAYVYVCVFMLFGMLLGV